MENKKMEWIHYLACFGGGAVLTNAIPHFVSGVMGRPFQSPFATPRGEGLSTSTVNVAWGLLQSRLGLSVDLPRRCVRPARHARCYSLRIGHAASRLRAGPAVRQV
jgi:hypothetical protein